MAEARLIAAYLDELHHEVRRLPDADDIVAEVEDHLLAAREAHERTTRDSLAAELQALAQFGTPSLVSKALIAEARKGAAVPTTFTRRAGIAALLIPLFAVIGQAVNVATERGFLHGIGVTLLGLTLPLLIVAVIGVYKRHRGALHGWGIAAAVVFIASPILAIPFAYGAGVAFILIVMIAMALLATGMLRAHVLPRLPILMFGFSGPIVVAGAGVAQAFGHHAGNAVGLGINLFEIMIAVMALGLGWLGWTMAHEDALGTPPTAEPLAAT